MLSSVISDESLLNLSNLTHKRGLGVNLDKLYESSL